MKIVHVEIKREEKTEMTPENFGQTVCHVKFLPS
jgi:hypothetical protein